MHNKKNMRCCMPRCIRAPIIKHTCFHEVKPQWRPLIHEYIKKFISEFEASPRMFSRMICMKHILLCGIQDKPLERLMHFPFLKISVSGQPQKDRLIHPVYSSEEIVIGREETIPVVKVIINSSTKANLIKRKRIVIHKTYPFDHTYAASASKLKLFQDELVKLGNENIAMKNQIERMTTEFGKELQRLDKVTHQLVKTNIKHISPGINYPFKCIPGNEYIQFYTGFSDRQCFMKFVATMRPKYVQARQKENLRSVRKEWLGVVNQLILFLSRLRLGLMLEDLAYRFNISVNLVIQTWRFWLDLMKDVLVKKSLNLDTKSCSPESNCKMVVESCETFFELTPYAKTRKMYGRARSVLELTADGCVFNVSDLFTAQANSAQFMDSIQSLKCIKSDKEAAGTFPDHVQKTLQFVKGFQILKGSFPNSTYDIDEINTFWKICCFLMNFSHPNLTAKYICSGGRSNT